MHEKELDELNERVNKLEHKTAEIQKSCAAIQLLQAWNGRRGSKLVVFWTIPVKYSFFNYLKLQ